MFLFSLYKHNIPKRTRYLKEILAYVKIKSYEIESRTGPSAVCLVWDVSVEFMFVGCELIKKLLPN